MNERDSEFAAAREAFAHAFEHADGALDVAALEEQDWSSILEEDAALAVGSLFSAQGSSLARSEGFDAIAAQVLGGEVADWVAAGARLVLPPLSQRELPTAPEHAGMVLGSAPLTSVLILERDRALHFGEGAFSTEALTSIDPGLPATAVSTGSRFTGDVGVDPADVRRVWALIDLAIAYETLAGIAEMKRIAIAFVLDRVVYGKVLGGYQVVKHQLTEVHETETAARAILESSWNDVSAYSSLLVRNAVSRASKIARFVCPQVCGGMSSTTEFPMHRYVRRQLLLDLVLGSPRSRLESVGTTIRAEHRMARIAVGANQKEDIR